VPERRFAKNQIEQLSAAKWAAAVEQRTSPLLFNVEANFRSGAVLEYLLALSGVERAKDLGQMFGRNTVTRIRHGNRGIPFQELNLHTDCTLAGNCLNRIQ
jgi:hypothetical protein